MEVIIPRRCLGEHCEGRKVSFGARLKGAYAATYLCLVERSKHRKSSHSVTGNEASSEHLPPLRGRRDLNSDSDEEDEEAVVRL